MVPSALHFLAFHEKRNSACVFRVNCERRLSYRSACFGVLCPLENIGRSLDVLASEKKILPVMVVSWFANQSDKIDAQQTEVLQIAVLIVQESFNEILNVLLNQIKGTWLPPRFESASPSFKRKL